MFSSRFGCEGNNNYDIMQQIDFLKMCRWKQHSWEQFSFLITCILKEEPRQGGKDSWAGEEEVAVVMIVGSLTILTW